MHVKKMINYIYSHTFKFKNFFLYCKINIIKISFSLFFSLSYLTFFPIDPLLKIQRYSVNFKTK